MFAGLRIWGIVGLVLVVISTFAGATLYIQSRERDNIQKEILEQDIETRQRIDESIRNNRYNSPDSSLNRLRDRQSAK